MVYPRYRRSRGNRGPCRPRFGISRSGQRQIEGTRDCERQIVEEVAALDQAMRTITNDYKDAQILNLGSEVERGPYLVTQTGIAPSDPLLETRAFVLRPDDTGWTSTPTPPRGSRKRWTRSF